MPTLESHSDSPQRARVGRKGQRSRTRLALLSATAPMSAAFCVVFCFVLAPTPSDAAVCSAGSESALANCINTVASGDTIQLITSFKLTADLPAVQTNNITINGAGFTLDGNNQFRGLFIGAFSGSTQVPVTVAIENLNIANTTAQGGAGGAPGGGGGAGLGGAIFVANLASVTVSNVNLTGSTASGGSGGIGGGAHGAGGGGMGGSGGNGSGVSGGGGGGLGSGANGGSGASSVGVGSAGIATGAAPGGFGTGLIIPGGPAGGGGGSGFGGGNGGGGGVGGGSGLVNSGGFGGGGGGSAITGGNGGFGGGGGGGITGGNGGFGGGGGSGGITGSNGGFGGGSGGGSGGGGLGAGGAIFVQQGGSLTLAGALTVNGNAVARGNGGGGGGVLTGGAGSAFGSGLFLQGNGTINFQPGSGQTQVISNVIADQTGSGGTGVNAGSWALNVSGGGTLVLNGANTYSGGTTVTGATLVVNGSIGDPIISAGGLLSGTGTVADTTVQNGGTFAPGNGTPGSSMKIAGNLAFQSGALYIVTLNPATSSFATVTGTATLTGASVLAVFAPGSYISKQYTILTAAGGINGTFAGINNTSLPAGFADTLSYNGNNVFLNLTVAPLGSGGGLSGNQQNVANTINNFFNSGGTLPPAFASLFNLSGQQLVTALSQLDGEMSTDAERGAFQLMNEFLGLMLDPFVDGRFGAGTSSFAPDREASLPPDIALAYASILKAPPVPPQANRWSVWGTGFGGSSHANGDPLIGSNDVTATTYGFASGADYHFTRDTLVGFALAGAGTNWGLAQSLGSGRSDAFQAGVYGKTAWGPVYLAAALAYTENWFTTNRLALGDQLTAKFNGESFGGRLESGYRFVVPSSAGEFEISPYGAIQAQSFHTPNYSETDLTGGGFGLTYNAMNATDTRSELGARFADMTAVGGMPLILRARLAWAHDWVDNPALNATFQTLPGASFIVNGAPIPSDSVLASVGAELHMTTHWSASAKFDGEFAQSSQTYAGRGTLRYTW